MSKVLSSQNHKPDTLVIIPAAGFGRRVGSPESKEMLVDPETGKPLIDRALQVAKNLGALALVVTRDEKKSLLVEIENRKKQGELVESLCVQPTQEWPDTILRSASLWLEKNILILPDTTWEPLFAVEELRHRLNFFSASYGIFDAADDLAFGFVSSENEKLQICEKPKNKLGKNFRAWGLMAFRKDVGEEILQAHLSSTFDHEIKICAVNTNLIGLQRFADLTRASF